MSADRVTIRIRGGGLYMSAVVCDHCFAGVEAVVLLRLDENVVVLPVRHAAAGGYLLKRRDATGDRVRLPRDAHVVFARSSFRVTALAMTSTASSPRIGG
ncbi:hypothetical protein [Roseivivax sediminis]|uniref:hypothetical protein n=1 Tax=Roseivivax sediminis TaxID=936889 RepID=UPI00122CD36E|nr:hypothetical protein [Roseivivax sediminis]